MCKLSRWSFQLLLTTASSCGGCFSWYVVEVYFHMYSIYEGGFYGDYYSEAVMCGTMSEMKRVTCKYVLEYVHTWYIVRVVELYLCGYAIVASIQARHNCLQFGIIVNHIIIKSIYIYQHNCRHPLQSHTPSSSIQYLASITQ